MQDTRLRDLTRVFGALADETRLRMLAVLQERECCVCEVEEALDIAQYRASRNLAILRDADLIRARRDGAWVVYSLNDDWPLARSIVETATAALADSPTAARDAERLRGVRCRRQPSPELAVTAS